MISGALYLFCRLDRSRSICSKMISLFLSCFCSPNHQNAECVFLAGGSPLLSQRCIDNMPPLATLEVALVEIILGNPPCHRRAWSGWGSVTPQCCCHQLCSQVGLPYFCHHPPLPPLPPSWLLRPLVYQSLPSGAISILM